MDNCQEDILKNKKLSLIKKNKFASYNISTQPSVWDVNFLKQVLQTTTDPWSFEVHGNSAFGSKKQVLAFADPTFTNFPTRWIHKGAVSRHIGDHVNLLGLRSEVIEEMIKAGLVDREKVIFGLWPNQKEIVKYTKEFHPSELPVNDASPTQWTEYYNVYSDKKFFKVRDRNFARSIAIHGFDSCSDGLRPTEGYWSRKINSLENLIVYTDFFLDEGIIAADSSFKKVALLLEPRSIHPWAYERIEKLEHHFDYILTYDEKLLKRGDKYIKYVVGSSRIPINQQQIYEKTKLVSMIASKKNITEGHKLRHKIAKKYGDIVDCWGYAYKEFESKVEPLKDYMFSLCVMNTRQENFVTEVLIDAFLSGTVPVFYGCGNIGDFFDTSGMVIFSDLEELERILGSLTPELYEEMLPAVKKNFDIAKNYLSTDDNIFKILRNIT